MKRNKLSEFHRENILEVAERLFSERGYVGATVDEIARAGEYSKSTIYVYFNGKEDIYNHIIFRGINLFKERLTEVFKFDLAEQAKYFEICNAITNFADEYPLYFEGITGNISIDYPDMDNDNILNKVYIVGEEINRLFIDFLSSGAARGVFRDNLNYLQIIFSFWASIGGIIKMASDKKDYIGKSMNMTKKQFLDESFNMLYLTIKGKN